jgi:hypothetical protein
VNELAPTATCAGRYLAEQPKLPAIASRAAISKGAKTVAVAKEFLNAIEPNKTDPFWLHSGDQHRTAYITETWSVRRSRPTRHRFR